MLFFWVIGCCQSVEARFVFGDDKPQFYSCCSKFIAVTESKFMSSTVSELPQRSHLRRNLRAMNADGFSFSIMVGIGETYLPAFMLSAGRGEFAAALIATVPLLTGSLLQLLAPAMIRWIGSYRRFVVLMSSAQAASLVFLAALVFFPNVPTWVFFVPATTYWGAGLSTGPAWNTWVEDLVPGHLRAGFFSRRSRLSHVGVLVGLFCGGMLLRSFDGSDQAVAIFAVLFGIGGMSRFVSALMLSLQSEGIGEVSTRGPILVASRGPVKNLLSSVQRPGPAGRFVLYLLTVQTGVFIAGPYFTPFMRQTLQQSWFDYMLLMSIGYLGKMISLPWAGRIANSAGVGRLMWIGGVGIIPISSFWAVSQSFWFLAMVQLTSGMVWGCYELAMLLQFFRQIPRDQRVHILTLYNLGNSAAMVLGTLIGAACLSSFGGGREAYLAVFVISSLARSVSLFLLPGGRAALRTTKTQLGHFVSRTIAVRPMAGSIERPVFSSFSDGNKDDVSEDSEASGDNELGS